MEKNVAPNLSSGFCHIIYEFNQKLKKSFLELSFYTEWSARREGRLWSLNISKFFFLELQLRFAVPVITVLLWSQNLDKLMKLKLLDLQTNRLTAIEGLECLVNLEELYLSRNHLEEIQGLDSLVCESARKGERAREEFVAYWSTISHR